MGFFLGVRLAAVSPQISRAHSFFNRLCEASFEGIKMTKFEVTNLFGLLQVADTDWVVLHCTQGSSDKLYVMAVQNGGLYTAYGRRGSTMNLSSDPLGPKARATLQTKMNEKLRKGYVVIGGIDVSVVANAGTTATAVTSATATRTLNFPVCLPTAMNSIEDAFVGHGPGRCVQEKMDGERVVIRASASRVAASSRSGRSIMLSTAIEVEFKELARRMAKAVTAASEWNFDTELVANVFHIFDFFPSKPCAWQLNPLGRVRLLTTMVEHVPVIAGAKVRVVPAHDCNLAEAKAFAQAVLDRGGEGVVLRTLGQFPEAGRSPYVFKVKFVETVDVVLRSNRSDKRSMQMSVVDKYGAFADVGNVSIPPNVPMPVAGDVAEVRYLYRNPGGALQQPVFLRVRADVGSHECTEDKIIRIKTPWALATATAPRANVAVCVNW